MNSTSRTGRALAALLLSAAGGLWFGAAPAQADGFCEDAGVNVVVDFQEIGGGVRQECVEDGGGKLAAQVFDEAGFDLTPVGAFPGVACQVDGKPTGVGCQKMPPATAYWGLFVAAADTWDYAPKGADQLKLEDGAYVAFSWQTSETPALPRVAPTPGAQPSGAAAPDSGADDRGEAAAKDAEPESDGLPFWVPILGVVALGAGVGAVMVTRRRGGA